MNAVLLPPDELFASLVERETRSTVSQANPKRASAHRCLGIVFSTDQAASDEHAFFGPVLLGLRERALARNNDLFLSLPRTQGGAAAGVERCRRHAVDGLIVMGVNAADPEILAAEQSGLPTVFLEYSAIGNPAGSVLVDNRGAVAEVVRHLNGLGHARIAHLAGDAATIEGQDRLRGFHHAMEQLGLPLGLVEDGNFTPRSGYAQMQRLLARPLAPKAVIAASDVQAVGALVALREAGLRCPEDVALTGFDDADFAARVDPPLTTVRQPGRALGGDVIDALNLMLDHPQQPPPIMLRPGELVVRESCGAHLRERSGVSS